MNRELWLIRHAKAKISPGKTDFDRGLKNCGEKAGGRMGLWLKQQHLQPDYVLSSPALRTMSTAKLVCPYLGIAEYEIHQDPRLYLADLATFKKVLQDCPQQAKKVLLVGHNPGLAQLFSYLAVSVPILPKLMPTSGFVRLKMPLDWRELEAGSAELIALMQVKTLFAEDEENLKLQNNDG